MQHGSAIELKSESFTMRCLESMSPFVLLLVAFTLGMAGWEGLRTVLVLGLSYLILTALYLTYRCRYCITKVKWCTDGQVSISYLDFDRPKHFQTNISSLNIYKGLLWSEAISQPYLVLKVQRREIRQFAIGGWTEAMMDELLLNWPLRGDSTHMNEFASRQG